MPRDLAETDRDTATLQSLWRGFAARGDAPALITFTADAREVWSYAKLAERSARVAAALCGEGIARGDGVALIAPNSARWIDAFWGIVAAGSAAIPLDAQNDDATLSRMLSVGACRFVFTTKALAQRVRALAPSCRIVILDSDATSEASETWVAFLAAESAMLPEVAPRDPAVVVFTSGTTGSPKAVPLTHRNLMTNVLALAETRLVGGRDRALLPLPLYHAYPLTIGMITPLALGCAVVLPAGISGPELLVALRSGEVTALVGVPRLYVALLDNIRRTIDRLPATLRRLMRLFMEIARWANGHGLTWPGRVLLSPVRRRIAPRLRLLVSGGAAVPTEVEQSLDALGWRMLTGYGLVETSSMLTFNPLHAAMPGSAGKPVRGMEVRIANADASGVGEIEVRGPSLFSGYRDDPAKTREAFTADGWFRTGDLGALDACGYLHIAARKAETIVLADGKKLFPEEFETVYARAPLVRELALLGIDGALTALVVPDLDAARQAGAMRLGDALREGLAAVAMQLPSHARLSGFAISHEALPRTQLGKIRRHFLPAIYAAAQRHEGEAVAAPLSAEDRALLEQSVPAGVWRWLHQQFPGRQLSLDTILQLDLGIDSLGWVDLTLALQHELGLTLREQDVARVATIRDLLHAVRSAPATETASAAAADWIAPNKRWMRFLRRCGETLISAIMHGGFRVKVTGREHLPAHGPMLICPNHVSYLDPFAVGVALPRALRARTYWGGWSGVAFNTGLRRAFSRVAQVLPIDPDRAAGAGLSLGRQVLARGDCLVWFPEGGRSLDGTLQRFLPGVGALLAVNPVPVVPVFIDGTFSAWPVGRRFPRAGRISVHFGAPVAPFLQTDEPGRARDEKIATALHDAVASLAASRSRRPAD